MREASSGDAGIQLDADTALILFELLSRWIADGKAPPPDTCFQSRAECAALSAVLSQLESQLVAPLKFDYPELLASARERLSEQWHLGFLSPPPN